MFLFIIIVVLIVQDFNSIMKVWEMFMYKVIVLVDLKVFYIMVYY